MPIVFERVGRIVKRLEEDYLGFQLSEGDIILVGASLRGSGEKYVFKAFNTHLCSFILKDEDGEDTVYLPLPQVKRMVKMEDKRNKRIKPSEEKNSTSSRSMNRLSKTFTVKL